MAFDGSDPAWCVAVPMHAQTDWRLRIAQFGDGYEQRTLDGINALDRKWSVHFEMKPASVIQAMDAYLAAELATAFPFRDPATGVVHNVFCDSWQVDWVKATVVNGVTTQLLGTLSAEFRKAYGVTV